MLRPLLPVTRLVAAPSLSRGDSKVFLKLESDLPTGSFKVRGALYALSLAMQRGRVGEVIAHSTGNHGAAVAYAAKLFQLPARIFLPENPNPVKRNNIARLGAQIVERGRDSSEAFEHATEYARAEGVFFLNDATDPELPAGPATIACEVLEQLPETSAIFVPIGDTALIRGVAAAAKHLSPSVRIVGVQAEQAPSYYLSWKEKRVVPTETCNTLADGLATRTPDPQNVAQIVELVDDVVTVSEQQMLDAIRHLLLEEHIVAEGAGAAATAAWIQRSQPARNTVLLMSGANASQAVLQQALSRG
ncbi:MAG: pyridoxal-phosphate dependent enzyme [Acidobacteriia bacterium]|nr:pyridoxal-phosphate dependent enzyme [Terriglobia bacterium]